MVRFELESILRPALLIAVSFLAVVPMESQARDTARQFLAQCQQLERAATSVANDESQFLAGYCIGVIQGVSDGSVFTAAFYRTAGSLDSERNIFCIPDDVSKRSIAKSMVDYGVDHPELLDGPEIQFIVLALRDRFPCE